jgi:hypothetical protein
MSQQARASSASIKRTAWTLAAALATLASSLTAGASAKDESYPPNYRTELRALRPAVPGLKLEPAGGDRYLMLRNDTGKTVVVVGYDDDPYLRFRSNRLVEVNVRSPSKYVNEDRFGTLQPPPSATPGATPKWKRVAGNGSYRWFDHRIHWMEKTLPPQVKNRDKRWKIFDWVVPLRVDDRSVKAAGTLIWVPDSSSGGSPWLIIAIGVAALALVAGGVLVTRRWRPASAPAPEKPRKEAW